MIHTLRVQRSRARRGIRLVRMVEYKANMLVFWWNMQSHRLVLSECLPFPIRPCVVESAFTDDADMNQTHESHQDDQGSERASSEPRENDQQDDLENTPGTQRSDIQASTPGDMTPRDTPRKAKKTEKTSGRGEYSKFVLSDSDDDSHESEQADSASRENNDEHERITKPSIPESNWQQDQEATSSHTRNENTLDVGGGDSNANLHHVTIDSAHQIYPHVSRRLKHS